MEPGGKGSFQTVKLQRPDRTTVCSHSARDMAATVASNPIIIMAVPGASACALVTRHYERTKTNSRMLRS